MHFGIFAIIAECRMRFLQLSAGHDNQILYQNQILNSKRNSNISMKFRINNCGCMQNRIYGASKCKFRECALLSRSKLKFRQIVNGKHINCFTFSFDFVWSFAFHFAIETCIVAIVLILIHSAGQTKRNTSKCI